MNKIENEYESSLPVEVRLEATLFILLTARDQKEAAEMAEHAPDIIKTHIESNKYKVRSVKVRYEKENGKQVTVKVDK